MGSELRQLIEQEAQSEKDKILADARARADEILAGARREAEDILATGRQRVEEDRTRALTQAQSTASLRAAALVLIAKDEVIRKVFEQAEAQVRAAVANAARRRAMLRDLLRESLRGLPGGRVTVEVAPGDVQAVQEVCRELRTDVEVRANAQVVDGVQLISPDGRAMVENTVPSRLERARREMVSRVAEVLWGR
jgi:V/A-type H+/Na+-transporting ATPase subunit E